MSNEIGSGDRYRSPEAALRSRILRQLMALPGGVSGAIDSPKLTLAAGAGKNLGSRNAPGNLGMHLVRLLQRDPLLKITKPIQHDVDLWRRLLLGLRSRRVLRDEKLLSIGSDVVRTSIGIREIDKSR